MSTEHPPENYSSRPVNDHFWAAIFSQEESIAEELAAEEIPVENCEPFSEKPEDLSPPPAESENHQDPWLLAQELYESDHVFNLPVTGHNKGGLLVTWRQLQGFVPASQLINFPQFHKEIERLNALQQWRDQQLKLKIIEVNRAQNRLIFSERAALVDAGDRERILQEISPGQHVVGEVTNLTNFGAFVDLGGVEGLIHISELSWSRVSHPSDIVKPGMEVKVEVLHVDLDNGRIALSLKRMKHDPWATVEQNYQAGQIIQGEISKIVSFGAFVQIEDELEGLIHISELAEGTFLHPRNVVQRGQQVKARILQVDGKAKRLALSLRGISG